MPVIINGTTGISGVDGSAASPAIEGSDTNTGMFFPAADTIAFAEGGVEVLRINSSAQVEYQAGTSSLPTVTASGDLNTGIFFPAADTVALATSGAEGVRVGPLSQVGLSGANYGLSGQVITSGGASAAPTWTNKGMILLGTISTTSGTNPTLSGLTLTNYNQVLLVWQGVGHDSGTSLSFLVGTSTADDLAITNNIASTGTMRGVVLIDLAEGTFYSVLANAGTLTSNTTNLIYGGDMPITTASTTISIALSAAGNFDSGSIRVYGVA